MCPRAQVAAKALQFCAEKLRDIPLGKGMMAREQNPRESDIVCGPEHQLSGYRRTSLWPPPSGDSAIAKILNFFGFGTDAMGEQTLFSVPITIPAGPVPISVLISLKGVFHADLEVGMCSSAVVGGVQDAQVTDMDIFKANQYSLRFDADASVRLDVTVTVGGFAVGPFMVGLGVTAKVTLAGVHIGAQADAFYLPAANGQSRLVGAIRVMPYVYALSGTISLSIGLGFRFDIKLVSWAGLRYDLPVWCRGGITMQGRGNRGLMKFKNKAGVSAEMCEYLGNNGVASVPIPPNMRFPPVLCPATGVQKCVSDNLSRGWIVALVQDTITVFRALPEALAAAAAKVVAPHLAASKTKKIMFSHWKLDTPADSDLGSVYMYVIEQKGKDLVLGKPLSTQEVGAVELSVMNVETGVHTPLEKLAHEGEVLSLIAKGRYQLADLGGRIPCSRCEYATSSNVPDCTLKTLCEAALAADKGEGSLDDCTAKGLVACTCGAANTQLKCTATTCFLATTDACGVKQPIVPLSKKHPVLGLAVAAGIASATAMTDLLTWATTTKCRPEMTLPGLMAGPPGAVAVPATDRCFICTPNQYNVPDCVGGMEDADIKKRQYVMGLADSPTLFDYYTTRIQQVVFDNGDMQGTIALCGEHIALYPVVRNVGTPTGRKYGMYAGFYACWRRHSSTDATNPFGSTAVDCEKKFVPLHSPTLTLALRATKDARLRELALMYAAQQPELYEEVLEDEDEDEHEADLQRRKKEAQAKTNARKEEAPDLDFNKCLASSASVAVKLAGDQARGICSMVGQLSHALRYGSDVRVVNDDCAETDADADVFSVKHTEIKGGTFEFSIPHNNQPQPVQASTGLDGRIKRMAQIRLVGHFNAADQDSCDVNMYPASLVAESDGDVARDLKEVVGKNRDTQPQGVVEALQYVPPRVTVSPSATITAAKALFTKRIAYLKTNIGQVRSPEYGTSKYSISTAQVSPIWVKDREEVREVPYAEVFAKASHCFVYFARIVANGRAYLDCIDDEANEAAIMYVPGSRFTKNSCVMIMTPNQACPDDDESSRLPGACPRLAAEKREKTEGDETTKFLEKTKDAYVVFVEPPTNTQVSSLGLVEQEDLRWKLSTLLFQKDPDGMQCGRVALMYPEESSSELASTPFTNNFIKGLVQPIPLTPPQVPKTVETRFMWNRISNWHAYNWYTWERPIKGAGNFWVLLGFRAK